ncbi:MAG: LysR family transcriptional regulator [Lachnospiraceae bacterium]|nr:LysR family transcriptional regulator [Lachnospiraceae bacterium]
MDLLQLRYFKRVAEFENITRAAESLSVAQPAISKMIKQLENELNGPLFDRIGRNIVLNDRGRLLLNYATDILHNVDRIYENLQTGVSKKEKIFFSVSVCSSLIPQILSKFTSKHPDYQIVISTKNDYSPVDLELFQSLHEINEKDSFTILKEDIVLAVPNEHPLATRNTVRLHELSDLPIIGLKQEKSLTKLMEPFFKLADFTPNMSLEIDNPETLRKLVNMGYGASFIPRLTWIDAGSENIRLIPIEYPSCYRYINLRIKKGYVSDATKCFKDFLIDFFENDIKEQL